MKSARLPIWLREPFFQFLILGALLFFVYSLLNVTGLGSDRIVITSNQIHQQWLKFQEIWNRQPTDEEFQELIEDQIRTEIAVREAEAMGLGRNNPVFRNKLQMLFELQLGDPSEGIAPTDAELEKWMKTHASFFMYEPRITFRQIMIRSKEDPAQLLKLLTQMGPNAKIEKLGAPTILPPENFDLPRSTLIQQTDESFAKRLFELPIGTWQGPVESPYGLHLVLVISKSEETLPPLASIRSKVEGSYRIELRRKQLKPIYDKLAKKYSIRIEEIEGQTSVPKLK